MSYSFKIDFYMSLQVHNRNEIVPRPGGNVSSVKKGK